MESFSFKPIGVIRSCYKEKFGTPRQSGLISTAEAVIELYEPYCQPDYSRGLEDFSHLWLIFVFDQHLGKDIKATVRPPRLGGNKRVGVFASRSPFRPNAIGLSVVRIKEIQTTSNKVSIIVTGVDIVDNTPLLDIKPYIPYADMITDAGAGYASIAPDFKLTVAFSDTVYDALNSAAHDYSDIKQLITETISLDPRPAYITEENEYGVRLYEYNIRWKISGSNVLVTEIQRLI